ncbi:MAG: Holliday junction branch migration protein RuvA [Planctomycetota bacterium]
MITRITGTLSRVELTEAYVDVGPYEHEVLVPDFVRRHLLAKTGEVISLRTIEYIDGNPQRGRMTPRLIGFLADAEREFFEMFCEVDGVGVKKALRAMVRPVRDVAASIEEQDVKALTTLPGIGAATAERVVAKLRRKMTKFALIAARDAPAFADGDDVLGDGLTALIALGHSPEDARKKIEAAGETGGPFKSVEDLLEAIYRRENS